jgi:RNA-binding protein YhbY
MLDHDALLGRVRKLLAKAEDPAVTEAEAESYNTKAAQLIARYGIDRAMLAAADNSTDEITTIKISLDNPYSRDKAGLLTNIAHPLRCRALLHRWGQTVTAVTVFGFRSDLERVELLFTSLLLQATTQLTRVRPVNAFRGESLAAYRRTWLHGFAGAVQVRLQKSETNATQEHAADLPGGQSAELVLRDRNALVKDAYDDQFGNLRAAPPRRLSGSGYLDGRVAGEQANLGTTGLRGGKAAIPAR